MKIKLFAFIATLAILVSACDSTPHYDASTMMALQPCMSMGFEPAQCMAAYQQAGRPHVSDTNWLGTVAAFAAGAAANHWWNRDAFNDYRQYQFRPDYMNDPGYYDRYYNTHQRRSWRTPQVQGIPNQAPSSTTYTTNPSVPKLVPEKNTQTLIPGQKAQPLFTNPINIAPNQAVSKPVTPPTTTTAPVTSFRPIQVAPPAPAKKSWSLFGGSSSSSSSSASKPPVTTSKPSSSSTTSAFRPIRVAPSKSYSSSSSSKRK